MPKKKEIFVSVVTPSYNQGRYIERAIKSFINQDYPNKEMVIVDGGSNDATVDILKRYDKDIRWISRKDRGFADGVNKGISLAKGSIVVVLSSDDYFAPGALSNGVKYIRNHPDNVLWCGKVVYLDKDNQVVGSYSLPRNITFRGCLEGSTHPHQDACFFRKGGAERIGGFPLEYNVVADLLFYLKLLSLGDGFGFKEPISFYQYHDEQATVRKVDMFIESFEEGILNMSKSVSSSLIGDENYIESVIKLTQSFWFYRSGRYEELKKSLTSCVKVYPPVIKIKRFQFLLFKLIIYKLIANFSYLFFIKYLDKLICGIVAESSRTPRDFPPPDWV
jgi:glycosyltransferase involved in cell wall biosynthesis